MQIQDDMPEEKSAVLKRTAIHEAGHIIMAHYFGCTINSTLINGGEGETSISWNENQRTINILTRPELTGERRFLIGIDKNYMSNLANVFIMVLSAGSAAEAVYEKQLTGTTSITNLNAGDNDTIADFIDAMETIEINLPKDIVSKKFQVVYSLFSKENFWSAIDELSTKIIASGNQLQSQDLKAFLSEIVLN